MPRDNVVEYKIGVSGLALTLTAGEQTEHSSLLPETAQRLFLVTKCYRSGMLFLDTTTLQLKPNLVNSVALRFTTWTSGGRLRDIRELLSSSFGGKFQCGRFFWMCK